MSVSIETDVPDRQNRRTLSPFAATSSLNAAAVPLIASSNRRQEFNPFITIEFLGKKKKIILDVVQITDGHMELCYLLLPV